MNRSVNHCRHNGFFAGAFSFLELQITLVILSMGLMSFAGLYRVYSLQTAYIEKTHQSASTYYVVSQANRWMRQLGVPAEMEQTAGAVSWTPPVSSGTKYRIRLDSFSRDFEQSRAVAEVTMEDISE